MGGLLAMLDYDSESNTDHAQFRQYSSTEGRFLSPDPYGGSYDPANPQSFNRYEYALDNPLSNIDPSGLDCQDGWYSADEEGDCFPGVPGYGGGGGAGAGGGSQGDLGDGTGPNQEWISIPIGQTCVFFPYAPPDCSYIYGSIWFNSSQDIIAAFPIISPEGGVGGIGTGGAPSTGTKTLQLLKCASKAANQFSIAGFAGLTSEGGSFGARAGKAIGTAFLGNTFSGISDTFTHVGTGSFGAAYGDFALGGTAQGLPLGTSVSAKGIVGVTTDAAVGATLGAEMVEPVGWAKLAIDGLVFGGSVLSCLGN